MMSFWLPSGVGNSAGGAGTNTVLLVRLAVGDEVVYRGHGIGHVTVRQTRMALGVEAEMVVVELADGLTVTFPIERAQEQLRPLASESDLRRVQATLRQSGLPGAAAWPKRRDEARKKLSDGGAVGLAELVRDGADSERARAGKRGSSRLSAGEKELYGKARQLLVAEVALARGMLTTEANAWIDQQIGQRADDTNTC